MEIKAILCLSILPLVFCENFSHDKFLRPINEETLDILLSETNYEQKEWFLFFSEWEICKECLDGIKEWIKLSNKMKNISIGLTDCEFDREVCEFFGIRKFPTILFFKERRIFHYENPKLELESFIDFIA